MGGNSILQIVVARRMGEGGFFVYGVYLFSCSGVWWTWGLGVEAAGFVFQKMIMTKR